MPSNIGGSEIVIIAFVILAIFVINKIIGLSRRVGESDEELRRAKEELKKRSEQNKMNKNKERKEV